MKTKSPKLTVNKLGEYLVATPKRQRQILEQIKYPIENKFGATAHSEAREAIKKYFINGFDDNYILDCIKKLTNRKNVSDYQKLVDASSIEFLNTLLKSKSINRNYTYEDYKGNNPHIKIEGVDISVYPDLVIRYISRGQNNIGAIKFHLSKNSEINEEAGKYISTILNYYTCNYIVTNEITKPKYNISFDVPKDLFLECPTGIQRRWENINAGCKNICAIWDSI